MAKKSVLGTTHPAVIAVWAAVLAAATVLPSIPLIGTGGTFSLATALFPLSGVFFGPIGGFITAAIGSFIGGLLAPHTAWMGMATFLVGAISALAAGCVTRGEWKYSAVPIIIIAIGVILWFSHPIGQDAPILPAVYYTIGVIAIIVGTILNKKGFLKDVPGKKAVAIFFIGLAAMITTASWANYIALVLFATPAEVWYVLAFQAPIERIIFSVGTAIIGVPLLLGLPKIGVFVGPTLEEDFEDEEE